MAKKQKCDENDSHTCHYDKSAAGGSKATRVTAAFLSATVSERCWDEDDVLRWDQETLFTSGR